MGPSIATEIILKSGLNKYFTLYHLDTNTHEKLSTLGEWTANRIKKNLKLYFKMAYLIIKNWPDLVVIPISQTTSGFIKDSVYILISRFFLRKTLLQLRGSNFKNWLSGASTVTRAYVAMVLHRTQGVMVQGEKLKYLFQGFLDDDQIFAVPNGADFNIVPGERLTDRKFKLLYLSNLQPSKGIEDMLEALVLLKKDFNNTKFKVDVVGSWLDEVTRNKCIALVGENNLPVTFHPPVFDNSKFSFLLNADILIFPPREPEGHPWVIVEAMAAGLPIISTDHGAITESVIDGVNGFIVEKQNPQQIAEKIVLLSQNQELRTQMGRAGRHLYEENFTEDKMVQRMVACFNKVLNPYDVKEWYDGLAKKWGDNYIYHDKSFSERLKNVHQLVNELNEKSHILDIGCGSGEITASVYERFRCNVTGIDVSDKMIEHCKDHYSEKNLSFELGDILNLHFPSGHFDLVLSLSVIEWLEDYEGAIAEVSRVLKLGGQWIVSLPNWVSPFRKIEKHKGVFFKNSYLRYQKNHVPISEFKKVADSHGLKTTESIFHVLPFYKSKLSGKFGQLFGMMCIMSMTKS
jgi:glycosyltransferase involved in cell wall biosynthesis/ubiquinone/menaquinone biosynthesis C-methylase UbiE